jgi:hypothetical protein
MMTKVKKDRVREMMMMMMMMMNIEKKNGRHEADVYHRSYCEI